MQLEAGQVAVVTGGASGIGLAMGRAFAGRGLDVVVADLRAAELEAAAAAIEAEGARVLSVTTDVRSAEAVDALAARTLERFGRVDVICNNAGVVSAGPPMWEIPQREWDWALAVNLGGVIHGIRAFVPHLVAQNRGHVVNTASIAGLIAQAGTGPYLASKHAVVAISEGLALELEAAAPEVGVTVVCPGVVDTGILDSGRDGPIGFTIGELTRMAAAGEGPSERNSVIPPSDVADAVLRAIEARRLHIAPNAWVDEVRAHVDQLLDDLTVDEQDVDEQDVEEQDVDEQDVDEKERRPA